MTLWASQILQGMAMKYACEHWRRSMPRGMGTLYWQLNDTWPVASWSSIDYHGRCKALHYMARDFYAPLMISGVEDGQKGTVEVHVSNDLRQNVRATMRWRVHDVQGRLLRKGVKVIRAASGMSRKVDTLSLSDLLDKYGPRDLLVHLELAAKGQPTSGNLVTFARPKHIGTGAPARHQGDRSVKCRSQLHRHAGDQATGPVGLARTGQGGRDLQ